MNRKSHPIQSALAALMIVAFASYSTAQTLPNVQLKNMDGEPIATSDLVKRGKPYPHLFLGNVVQPL